MEPDQELDPVNYPPVAPEFHDLHKRVMKEIENDLKHWEQSNWATWSDQDKILTYDAEEQCYLINGELVDVVEVKNFCNTTYCYVGHALVMSGYEILYGVDMEFYCRLPGTSDKLEVHDTGMKVLGLTSQQADTIYETDGGGDVGEFKKEMTRITGINFD